MRWIRIFTTITFFALFVYAGDLGADEVDASVTDGADAGAEDWPEPTADDFVYETEVVGYHLRRTDEVTGFAETIDVGDQHKSRETVSDVVSKATGVEVRSIGGPGSFGAATIRGSTPNQVPVFLDGVILNLGGFSIVNLGDFSLDILDTIEVYRGNTPLSLGMGGIGGAIVLLTRDFEQPVTQLTAGYGSWNTWRLTTMRQDRLGPVRALVLFSAGGSDGDFEYFNINGTPNNSSDDAYVDRSNNQHTIYNALVKLNAEKGKWEGQLTDELFFIRQGVAGIDNYVDFSSAQIRRMRNSLNLRAVRSLGSRGETVFEIFNLLMKEDFRDPEGTVGLGHRSTVYESMGLGGSALINATISKNHRISSRAAFLYENYTQTKPGLPNDEQPNPIYRIKPQIGVEYELNLASKFYAVPIVRGEMHYSHFDGAPLPELLNDFEATTLTEYYVSPSLGLRYLLNDVFTVRANGGRYVRTPELTELFGDHGHVIGNPELEEEVGYNFDAGVTSIVTNQSWLDLIRFDAVFFASLVNNLISLEQNSQSTSRPENIEQAEIKGLEFSFRLSAFKRIGLSGNYTYFHGINKSDIPYYVNKQLPGRSPHQVYARFELKNESQRVNLTGWYDFDYSSKTYLGQYNAEADVSMHLFHGVGGRVEYVPFGLSFTLEVDNLTDDKTFRNEDGNTLPISDYLHYPLPGRAVFGTLHWDIP